MLDAGTAYRPTGGYEYVDGEETHPVNLLFSARCKIQERAGPGTSEVGGRTAVTVRTELHLPVATQPLAVGDRWEVTAAVDGSLSHVGQTWRVEGPVAGTLKTARRYEVIEVVT